MGNCSSDLSSLGDIEEIAEPIVSDGLIIAADHHDLCCEAKGLHVFTPQIELSLSATNLGDREIASKSDPIAVVYIKTREGELEELGRTQVTLSSFGPSRIQKINITYHFEIVQPLIIHVYDVDAKYHNVPMEVQNLKDLDFLGEATCILSEILSQWDRSMPLTLPKRIGRGSRNLGMLTIHAKETDTSKKEIQILVRAAHLENNYLFSKTDRFLRISRIFDDGVCIPICKTETVKNSNLEFKPFHLFMDKVVTKENPLLLECFGFSSSGDHTLIGIMHKSVEELELLHKTNVGSNFIMPPSGSRDQTKVLKGQLFVSEYKEQQTYSFLDYLAGGCELNYMVAVDFTSSNGDPRSPESLHYIDPSGSLNAYQQAIMEVGDVIQYYNSDRLFPAWGFGGVTSTGFVSHCFNLSPKGFQLIANLVPHQVTTSSPLDSDRSATQSQLWPCGCSLIP